MADYHGPDWHSSHADLWLSVIPPLLPDRPIRWLEIGSFEGRSAAWTLEHLLRAGDELVCLDTFADADREQRFDENLAGRATKVKSRSIDYLRREQGEFFCVYIDGNHDAPDVLADAVLSWQLLEVGGVMICDDYLWQHPKTTAGRVAPGVAIDGFLAAFVTRAIPLHIGYQVIIRKRRGGKTGPVFKRL